MKFQKKIKFTNNQMWHWWYCSLFLGKTTLIHVVLFEPTITNITFLILVFRPASLGLIYMSKGFCIIVHIQDPNVLNDVGQLWKHRNNILLNIWTLQAMFHWFTTEQNAIFLHYRFSQISVFLMKISRISASVPE